MIPGDIVEYMGKRWVVGFYKPEIKSFLLYDSISATLEVPDDAKHTVICNPAKEWPFVSIKELGQVSKIIVPVPRGTLELAYLEHWVTNSPDKRGGSVFLEPSLKLKLGDTLNITYASGKISRASIPRLFSTVAQRVARATAKPKEPKTAFDHLIGNDDD